MALSKGRVNPLNVIGQRRLPYIPTHFAVMRISDTLYHSRIDEWIYHNLDSRYCVRLRQVLDPQRRIIEVTEIGVEDPKELTMLSLVCPYLHTK